MCALPFKLLVAVFSKIVFTTSLCTALVATRWYLESFMLRVIEWLELFMYYRQTIILMLLFLVLLQLQRFLYNYRDSGKVLEFEHLHGSNEKKSNTNFLEGLSSWKSGEFDTILDFVLREASGHIFGSQTIPDVCKTFEVPVPMGLGRRQCRFTATEGNVQHMNSLHRHGPATVRQQVNGGVLLSAAVGLRHVSLRFRRYTARVDMGILPPFYASGEILAVLSSLSLRVEVVLTPSFSAELRSLHVENFGPMHLDVTGLGEWNFMWPKIREAVVPTIQKQLECQAVEQVKPILRVAFRRMTALVASIPKIHLLPQTSGRPKMIGALETEPSLTLTPSSIAIGGGLLVGTIALLGMGLAAALRGSSSRSDDEDD